VNEHRGDRLSVPDAAKILNVTPEAIRQRIRRNTIDYEYTEDGRYYVYITPSQEVGNGVDNAVLLDYVESLKQELEAWKEEARRKDHIIAGLVERVPALEAPRDERESPAGSSGMTERVETPTEREPDSQPWWEPQKQPETAFDRWERGTVPLGNQDDPRPWWKRMFGR